MKVQFMKKLAKFFSSIVSGVFSIIPWSFNIFFAKVFAFLWVDVFSIRKKIVHANLDIVFKNLTPEQKNQLMKKSLIALARSFFDVMRIPSLTSEWIDQSVILHGAEKIKKEQGYLFLSLHLGSGDLGAAVVSHKLKPLSLISKRFKNQFLDQFWFSLRTKSQTEFIDAHAKNNAFEILKALKNKRGVVFVLDQFMGKPYGIASTFFGRTTGTAYGLSLFAQKTKAPVVPLYTYWDNQQKLNIVFGDVIQIEDLIDDSIDQNLVNQRITNRFNSVLESIICQHPDQWMWVHRRWKDFE